MENIKKLVGELNQALLGDSVAAIATAREAANKAVADYNAEMLADFFEEFKKDEAPMLAAIKQGEIPWVKLSQKEEKGIITVKVDEVQKVVNLAAFEDAAKTKVSNDGKWRWKVEPFTRNVLKNLAGTIEAKAAADYSKFAMSDKAEQKPIASSNTQLLAQLQEIIEGIIAGYKVDSRDLNFIKMLAVKRGKKMGSITNVKATTMLELIEIALHQIVTKAAYTAEFKTVEPAVVATPAA